jgi:MSHA biogenesis protein MshP
MCPDFHRKKMSACANAQRGFSIVTAIFLLVIMAALGASMLTFFTVQQATAAQDLEGTRAYQAARAGIEWGLYQVLQVGAACPNAAPLPALGGTLSAYTVTVTCVNPASYNEAGQTVTVYQITSNAKNGAAPGSTYYVERQLQVTVSR